MTLSRHFGRGGIGYWKAENRILYAEKAHQSTSAGRFPKGEYNILLPIGLEQKVIVAQRLFSLKFRYPTAGSVHLQFLRRRIEAGFSSD